MFVYRYSIVYGQIDLAGDCAGFNPRGSLSSLTQSWGSVRKYP
jgi:hypothetical protein